MPNPQFVDYMTVFPQKDLISMAGNAELQPPVLDLGFDIEGHGRGYITRSSFEYLATLFGYIPESQKLETEQIYLDKIDVLIAENDRLMDVVDQAPAVIERLINGLHELTVSAVGDLLTVGDRSTGADSDSGDEGREDNPA